MTADDNLSQHYHLLPTKAHRYEQHQPDKRVVQPRPEQGRCQQGTHDQKPPHRRRACLDEMPFRPVIADRLALFLGAAQVIDQRVPEDEAERAKHVAAFERFCSVFPDAFYISERGRDYVDESVKKDGERG